jgi:membrane protein DedA with SNARE-associated domain/rhodanese-related sulfurtransferase
MGILGIIAHHGYAVTAIVLFLSSAGLPLPISIVLLGAGAAAHTGVLNYAVLLPLAWAAALAGDSILYFGGKYTGWWLLSGLCSMSANPEHCIFRSAEYFYRRGPRTLLFAKFLPGVGSMAAPLAGSLNMRYSRFLRMDAIGVFLYVAAYSLTGYLFSAFINDIIHWVQALGHAVTVVVILLVLTYAVMFVINRIRNRKYRLIERVSAAALHERLQTVDPDKLYIIADVRSHGYYDPGGHRIKNSIRVEPSRLKEELKALREFMQPECEIYLYCSCIKDTTSVRIAHMLEQENCKTAVIEGGLKAWIKAGGPIEMVPATDIEHLPRFD